jgi:F-type H+-transporting ATPase subunit delta
VIDKGVAKRYATALFRAALKMNALDAVLADLEALNIVLERDPGLIRFLSSPRELDEAKEELIERLFTGRAHDLVVRLLLLLLRKGRILHLSDVVAAYRAAIEEHRGIAPARVVTAVPLEMDLSDRIRRELERLTGKQIRIRPLVDPRIIGGVIIMVEGLVYDRSVRHELNKLRNRLLEVRIQ